MHVFFLLFFSEATATEKGQKEKTECLRIQNERATSRG